MTVKMRTVGGNTDSENNTFGQSKEKQEPLCMPGELETGYVVSPLINGRPRPRARPLPVIDSSGVAGKKSLLWLPGDDDIE